MKEIFKQAKIIIKHSLTGERQLSELVSLLNLHPQLSQHIDEKGLKVNLLYYAVYYKNLNAIRLLIKRGADLEVQDFKLKQTPLLEAVIHYDDKTGAKITVLLLDAGANVNATNASGSSVLGVAVNSGNEFAVRQLISRKDINPNCTNVEGETPLYRAALKDFVAIGELLIRGGAFVDAENSEGRTALHVTGYSGSSKFAEMLFKYNANLHIKNKDDETALYIAVVKENLDVVRVLMEHGANPFKDKKDIDVVLSAALDHSTNVELFRILLHGCQHTKALYEIIVANDNDEVCAYLAISGLLFSKYQLEVLFLFSINNYKFDVAQSLFSHPNGLSRFKDCRIIARPQTLEENQWMSDDRLIFPASTSPEHQNALRDAFKQITALLENPVKCLQLLRGLDAKIAQYQVSIRCDFSKILPGDGIVVDGIKWPSAPQEDRVRVSDSQGLLRYLLRQQLAKHGIETQDKLYTFSGYVDTEVANDLVRHGSLFKEQYLRGNSLAARHGRLKAEARSPR